MSKKIKSCAILLSMAFIIPTVALASEIQATTINKHVYTLSDSYGFDWDVISDYSIFQQNGLTYYPLEDLWIADEPSSSAVSYNNDKIILVTTAMSDGNILDVMELYYNSSLFEHGYNTSKYYDFVENKNINDIAIEFERNQYKMATGTIISDNGAVYAPRSFFTFYSGISYMGMISAEMSDMNIQVNGINNTVKSCNIDDTNYISIRDFSNIMTSTTKSFDIDWNAEKSTIEIISPMLISQIMIEPLDNPLLELSTIYSNGNIIYLQTYTHEGTTYFKLRDIANLFDVQILWDATNGTMITVD